MATSPRRSKPSRVWRLMLAGSILMAAAIASLVLVNIYISPGPLSAELTSARAAADGHRTLKERFALLSGRHTNQCSLRPRSIETTAVNGRLQGSCCGAMVYKDYIRQIKSLRSYASVPEIPQDPYDISIGLAKRLLGYKTSIALDTSQASIYKRAMKMAVEHGPCCCHCWRWDAFEGQAKFLLTRRRYTAAQIARVWDLEDGCGAGKMSM